MGTHWDRDGPGGHPFAIGVDAPDAEDVRENVCRRT